MFLLYWDEANPENPAQVIKEHLDLLRDLKAHDAYICSEALGSAANATTVRVRGGKRMVTDGPYAETKETMGGFYILDCKDLDEALDFAARIPDARSAGVEVRPVMHVPDWPYELAADRGRRAM
jgi:hypothetical protein